MDTFYFSFRYANSCHSYSILCSLSNVIWYTVLPMQASMLYHSKRRRQVRIEMETKAVSFFYPREFLSRTSFSVVFGIHGPSESPQSDIASIPLSPSPVSLVLSLSLSLFISLSLSLSLFLYLSFSFSRRFAESSWVKRLIRFFSLFLSFSVCEKREIT